MWNHSIRQYLIGVEIYEITLNWYPLRSWWNFSILLKENVNSEVEETANQECMSAVIIKRILLREPSSSRSSTAGTQE